MDGIPEKRGVRAARPRDRGCGIPGPRSFSGVDLPHASVVHLPCLYPIHPIHPGPIPQTPKCASTSRATWVKSSESTTRTGAFTVNSGTCSRVWSVPGW